MRWRFFVRRVAMLLASLLAASFVIFAAVYLAPGSPLAALSGGRALPPSSIRVLEARYHLNEPFLAQYWYWLGDALHGNLGISITLRENVSTLIASRIWTTAGLVLYAWASCPGCGPGGWTPAR
jgi:peptide/nickel transport system permease protein